MPVKSMMITEQEKKDRGERSMIDDQEQFPFGLRIHLDPMSLKKLELSEMPEVGDEMVLLAKAQVVHLSMENKVGDEKQHSMSLQITELGVEDAPSDEKVKDAGEVLYGTSEGDA